MTHSTHKILLNSQDEHDYEYKILSILSIAHVNQRHFGGKK